MLRFDQKYIISIIGLWLFFLSGYSQDLSMQNIVFVDPANLLSKHRFSVMAKFIYVRHTLLEVDSQWALKIYQAHLYAINTCSGDGQQLNTKGKIVKSNYKNNINDYLASFNNLIESMSTMGFNPLESIIFRGEHTFLDGEHRLACSLFLNLRVPCKKIDMPDFMHDYSSEYFRTQKLSEEYLDAMALEYAKLKKNTYIVSLFSKARTKDSQVRALLNNFGSIIYEKEIILKKEGPFNLMKLYYMGEHWMGTWDNNFPGAYGKGSACFNLNNNYFPIRVFLWECDSLPKVRECKGKIRALFHMNNDSIHINDTHDETVRYAQAFFNKNSIHFLNNAKPKKFVRFLDLIEKYRNWISNNNIDSDCVCIDGSAALSAYGIRECNDLDVLHHGYDIEMQNIPYTLIGSHNNEMHYHVCKKDDIIFDPKNHFYCYGLKFSSLNIIKNMKQARNEQKDKDDVWQIIKYE